MIVSIPRNQITLSVLGTFFSLAGFGALTQDHVLGFFLLLGAGAYCFVNAAQEKRRPG